MGSPVAAAGTKKSKGNKTLAHLEIHPRMGGGHSVRHVYSGYDHEPKSYDFKDGEGGKAMAHIARHAGLPAVKGEGSMHEDAADANTEEED